MASSNVVTLTNGILTRMLKNPAVIKKFPRLGGVAKAMKKARGCRCSRSKANQQTRALNDFKTMLRSWPPGDKRQLKKMLNADRLRLFVGKRMVEF